MANILVGLLGLGIVITLHELGHLFVAKRMGITVEAFSVGWGPKIASFTRGGTEYRISWLPIGGYCKMQGEHALVRAWQSKSTRIDVEAGDFFAARPVQRIAVLLAGPVVNYLFAVLVLTLIAIAGYTITTVPNRIVLVSDYSTATFPADEAGLRTGDTVIGIDGEGVTSFRDLQSTISRSPRETLSMSVVRDGRTIDLTVTPELDEATGAGRIGVYPWVEPVVQSVGEGSPAELAGIMAGDRIVAVDGQPVRHTIAVQQRFSAGGGSPIPVTVERDGTTRSLTLIPGSEEDGGRIGIAYETIRTRSERFGILGGIAEGFRRTNETLYLTVRGIGLLFAGIDLNQALMGPVRITYLVGEVATEGFRTGVGRGLLSFFQFLSLISVTLFFMNLLPIPALDGGQIVLNAVEIISRRPLHPRLVYNYQLVGNVIIMGLVFFALFNDILFFARGS